MPDKKPDFREQYERLKLIAREIQKEDLPLEKAREFFEEGAALTTSMMGHIEGLKRNATSIIIE